MTEKKITHFAIRKETADAILGFLGRQAYQDVAPLINALSQDVENSVQAQQAQQNGGKQEPTPPANGNRKSRRAAASKQKKPASKGDK